MAIPLARFIRRFTPLAAMGGRRIPANGPRHSQLLLDSGRALMMLAAVVLTHQLGMSTGASGNDDFVLLAFLLWLLGAALTLLSFVARQFPRLAAAGVSVASVLRNYLLGGM